MDAQIDALAERQVDFLNKAHLSEAAAPEPTGVAEHWRACGRALASELGQHPRGMKILLFEASCA